MREKARKRRVLRYALMAEREVATLTGTSTVDCQSISQECQSGASGEDRLLLVCKSFGARHPQNWKLPSGRIYSLFFRSAMVEPSRAHNTLRRARSTAPEKVIPTCSECTLRWRRPHCVIAMILGWESRVELSKYRWKLGASTRRNDVANDGFPGLASATNGSSELTRLDYRTQASTESRQR
jgi:hypothetical protein